MGWAREPSFPTPVACATGGGGGGGWGGRGAGQEGMKDEMRGEETLAKKALQPMVDR